MENEINEFSGEYKFLSNFYIDSSGFCVELYYQAAKFRDHVDIIQQILKMKPGQTKRFAHKPENKSKIRKDWNNVSLAVMENFVRQKFSKELEKSMLINTGDKILIEGNTWHDNFYGSCFCGKCKLKPKLNHLGKMLMKIRLEVKQIQVI